MNTGRHSKSLHIRRQGRLVAAGTLRSGCQQAVLSSAAFRQRLARGLAAQARDGLSEPVFRQAAAEAEALAWSTSFPLLFLPALMEEKVDGARRWARRQREILERQRALALAA